MTLITAQHLVEHVELALLGQFEGVQVLPGAVQGVRLLTLAFPGEGGEGRGGREKREKTFSVSSLM